MSALVDREESDGVGEVVKETHQPGKHPKDKKVTPETTVSIGVDRGA
jgi:hypothetical protein